MQDKRAKDIIDRLRRATTPEEKRPPPPVPQLEQHYKVWDSHLRKWRIVKIHPSQKPLRRDEIPRNIRR